MRPVHWNRRPGEEKLRHDKKLLISALELLLEQPASPGGDPEILETVARRKLARELVDAMKEKP